MIEGIILSVMFTFWVVSFKNPNIIRLLLPRLFAGIIVGFLPLLIGEEMWKFVISLDFYTLTAIVSLSLSISFMYLRYEIINIVSNNKEVCKRALNIFTKGVLYSFSTGLIILDIFNGYFIKNMSDPDVLKKSNLYSGILGIIDPKVLLVFFPLALLIGIFVQIIWEEKPITEPL